MKRITSIKIVICTLVMVALMSATALAAVGQPRLKEGEVTTLPASTDGIGKEADTMQKTENMGQKTDLFHAEAA